jgi:membrane protein required for colicin V production
VADQAVRLVAGFVVLFIGVLVLGGLVQWLIARLVHGTGLSGTDRFLGFLFGSARGVLACIIGLIALRPFAESAEWWEASLLVGELLAFEDDVLNLLGRATEWVSGIGFKE